MWKSEFVFISDGKSSCESLADFLNKNNVSDFRIISQNSRYLGIVYLTRHADNKK